MSDELHVVGAGPAGLAAAITAADAGCRVVVHERADRVGTRFHGDLQGLESWTTESDVLDELTSLGLEPRFPHAARHDVTCFDNTGGEHRFRSEQPLFYLVRRGSDEGTLDRALLALALERGVVVHWHDHVDHLPACGGGRSEHCSPAPTLTRDRAGRRCRAGLGRLSGRRTRWCGLACRTPPRRSARAHGQKLPSLENRPAFLAPKDPQSPVETRASPRSRPRGRGPRRRIRPRPRCGTTAGSLGPRAVRRLQQRLRHAFPRL